MTISLDDEDYCHYCGQIHQMVATPFPEDGIYCIYAPLNKPILLPAGWSLVKQIGNLCAQLEFQRIVRGEK